MFPGLFGGPRWGDRFGTSSYSDSEDDAYGGRYARNGQRQGGQHRQPIKTPADQPRHSQQQGASGSGGQRGFRSAPVTPRNMSPAAAAQEQHHGQQQQQQQHRHHHHHHHQQPQPQPQQHERAPGPSRTAPRRARPAGPKPTPDQAATRIQTAWRGARLARQRPALRELAKAAAQLRGIREREAALLAEQAPQPLTQKQYLELSETAMKVMFALDAVSCGVPELRAKRKELTTAANKLLDELQAAHKSTPAAAAALRSATAAAGGGAVAATGPKQAPSPAASQQEQQARGAQGGRKWFRR